MRCKHGFREASRLKQRKCQQNRIAQNAPNAADDVIRKGQVLNQNCIDAYTDHDKKALESQCKQGAQIVLTGMALLMVSKGCERNRRKAHHEIYFHHSAIHDDKDDSRQRQHRDLNHKGLQIQSQQRS